MSDPNFDCIKAGSLARMEAARLKPRTMSDIENTRPMISFEQRIQNIVNVLNPHNKKYPSNRPSKPNMEDIFHSVPACEEPGCQEQSTCFCLLDDVYVLRCDKHSFVYWIATESFFESVEECADWLNHLQEKCWFNKQLFWDMMIRFQQGAHFQPNREWLLSNVFEYMKTWNKEQKLNTKYQGVHTSMKTLAVKALNAVFEKVNELGLQPGVPKSSWEHLMVLILKEELQFKMAKHYASVEDTKVNYKKMLTIIGEEVSLVWHAYLYRSHDIIGNPLPEPPAPYNNHQGFPWSQSTQGLISNPWKSPLLPDLPSDTEVVVKPHGDDNHTISIVIGNKPFDLISYAPSSTLLKRISHLTNGYLLKVDVRWEGSSPDDATEYLTVSPMTVEELAPLAHQLAHLNGGSVSIMVSPEVFNCETKQFESVHARTLKEHVAEHRAVLVSMQQNEQSPRQCSPWHQPRQPMQQQPGCVPYGQYPVPIGCYAQQRSQ